jgi:putative phosphoribosyl transferase
VAAGIRFRDRVHAGQELARHLLGWKGREDVIVLGLPRGGVPVAWEVANALGAPLDAFVVKKVRPPLYEELAIGAVATAGEVRNDDVIASLGLAPHVVDAAFATARAELRHAEAVLRPGRPPPDVRGRCVVLVDDGLATGATMRAAVLAVRSQLARHIVVAVPVGAAEAVRRLQAEAEVVCLATPEPFYAVGLHYDEFLPTPDEEVRALLAHPTANPEAGRLGAP